MLQIIFEIIHYGACVVLPLLALGTMSLCVFELVRQ